MFRLARIVSGAAHVGFDELAWLASTYPIDINELMMASSPPTIEEEVVNAAEDECGHFTSLSIINHMIIMACVKRIIDKIIADCRCNKFVSIMNHTVITAYV